jgi:mannose/cellobiose epimerase-like protein (N-acyl-D-glucosamine 2-epimerase family)
VRSARTPVSARLGTLALGVALAASSCGRGRYEPAPAALPAGEAWVAHLSRDLAPFWLRPEALGSPVGAFPTFRCDDGTLVDPELPCGEMLVAGPWVSSQLDKEFTRMRSRQTFFYGVAFHLTGEERYLALAKAGVDHIRSHALDRGSRSAVSWWRGGEARPPVEARSSQDLAYANLGLAFYAYLTRDPEVPADALLLYEGIFDRYDDPSRGLLRWAAGGVGGETARVELVAQLDQVNAYALLLASVAPEPHRTRLRSDLARIARILVARFWSEELGLFRGSLHDPLESGLGSRHTDFGHTIKALWMIERTGALLGDGTLSAWARERMPKIFARAYLPRYGCWASGLRYDGSLDAGVTWWIAAELDQAAATLALSDRRYTGYLEKTYSCWLDRLVDRENGEVWSWVDLDDPARRGAKQHLWKNGYHSAEHALVSYLTSQELHGKPATLHFAFAAPPPREELRPYFFAGEPASVEESALASHPALKHLAVAFRRLR